MYAKVVGLIFMAFGITGAFASLSADTVNAFMVMSSTWLAAGWVVDKLAAR